MSGYNVKELINLLSNNEIEIGDLLVIVTSRNGRDLDIKTTLENNDRVIGQLVMMEKLVLNNLNKEDN